MTTIFKHTNYSQCMQHTIDIVRNRTVSLDERHIVIVPDKYTLETERRIFDGTKGGMDCEIVTLNRLISTQDQKPLSKTASVMLIKKIVLQSKLVAFGMSCEFAGFALKVYDVIQRFKLCGITPQQLLQLDDLKLHDIAVIYEAYQEFCMQHAFGDSTDKLTFLIRQVKQGLLKDCHIYVVNFEHFDKLTQQVLQTLSNNCVGLTVSTIDSVDTSFLGGQTICNQQQLVQKNTIRQYVASSTMDELVSVAKRILIAKKNGIPFDKIGLVYMGSNNLLYQVFAEYNIPVNIDLTRTLDSFAVCVFLRELLLLHAHQYNKSSMVALAKNYFSPLSRLECDVFVSYTKKYAIDYKGFLTEWQHNKLAESARAKLVDYIKSFFAILQAKDKSELVAKLKEWVSLQERKSIVLGDLCGQNLIQVLNSLTKALDELDMILPDTLGISSCVKIFLESLSVPVGILPQLFDAVACGSPQSLRGSDKQLVFVVGLNEGVLPLIAQDTQLVVDKQIDYLRTVGVDLYPQTTQLNKLAKIELDNIIFGGSEIEISFVENSSYKKAFYLIQLERKVGFDYSDFEIEKNQINDLADFSQISLHLGNDIDIAKMILGGNLTNVSLRNACYYALLDKSPVDIAMRPLSQDNIINARQLVFANDTVSVSRIEQFMSCPYKHFAKYGLKLQEVQDGGTKPADTGSYLHTVLEEFVKCKCDIQRLDDIINSSLQIHYKLLLDANKLIRQRAVTEAKDICQIAAKQLSLSHFEPIGTEIEFGKDKQLPGIDYEGILMQGKIDRVDKYNKFVRLIDYKSGKAEFRHKDLYLGTKLQLLLYLNVFLRQGYSLAGSFYFVAKTKWDDDEFSYQLKGIYNSDADVCYAMDNSLKIFGYSDSSNYPIKSTVLNCSAVWDKKTDAPKLKLQQGKAVDQNTLAQMSQYASDLCGKAISNINDGYIVKSPLQTSSGYVCSYCVYKTICCSTDGTKPREFGTSVNKADVYVVNKTEN